MPASPDIATKVNNNRLLKSRYKNHLQTARKHANLSATGDLGTVSLHHEVIAAGVEERLKNG